MRRRTGWGAGRQVQMAEDLDNFTPTKPRTRPAKALPNATGGAGKARYDECASQAGIFTYLLSTDALEHISQRLTTYPSALVHQIEVRVLGSDGFQGG